MATTHRTVPFSSSQIESIGAQMDELAVSTSGKQSWVNIEPDVDKESIPTGSKVWKLFSARGDVIPYGSWVPVMGERRETHNHELGISHGLGNKAMERLERAGLSLPEGWYVAQDHKKRGLVIAVPPSQQSVIVVRFVTRALKLLSPFSFDDAYFAIFSEA